MVFIKSKKNIYYLKNIKMKRECVWLYSVYLHLAFKFYLVRRNGSSGQVLDW